MSLTLEQQYQVAMSAVQRRDVDLLSRLLTDPDTISPAENQTMAEQLGLKRGFLAAAVNVFSDPTVWMAALMSRVFPTQAWLRGTIPKRFVGAASEFTGASLATRTVENFFRGSNIPRLVAMKQRREAEVMAVGHGLFEQFVNRPNWKDEMPIVSMLLEGQNPGGATPELHSVANGIRGKMEELWGFLNQAKRIEGGFEGQEITRATWGEYPGKSAPQHLRNYLPHIPLVTDDSVVTISGKDALKKIGGSKFGQAINVKGEDVGMVWSPDASDRLSSDFSRYQAYMNTVGNEMNPRLFRRMRHGISLESGAGKELFITDLNVILPKYVHSVARTYALHAPISEYERKLVGVLGVPEPSRDPIMVQIINEGLDATRFPMVKRQIAGTNIVRDVLLPTHNGNAPMLTALRTLTKSVAGKSSDDEILFGNMFSSVLSKLDRYKAQLTGKQLTEADAALRSWERQATYRQKMNGIASYFYATTLGLNPWSAIQNMLQPIVTTMPAIGIGPTLAGYKVLGERLPRYFARLSEEFRTIRAGRSTGFMGDVNLAANRAFGESFPELAKQGIRIDPRLFDVDEAALGFTGGRVGFKKADNFYAFAMQPFTHAEMSNQIVSFYGGREAVKGAIRTGGYAAPKGLVGQGLEDLLDFEAGMIVNSTQFRPGPGSRTVLQSLLPAPLRQFTSFPTRMLNFIGESTVRGAMTQEQLNSASALDVLAGGSSGTLAAQKLFSLGTGRNLGTLARMYLFGRIATEGAAQALNVDLTGSLGITSAFSNVARDGQPFAPLPMPPAAQVLYGVVSAASTRDIKRMQPLELPGGVNIPIPKTLIPGGIMATRIARAMNQWRPDLGGFADEDERLMYRGNTSDLVLSMIGIPSDKGRRVRDTIERVQAMRDRMRSYRRAYATAASNYDMPTMGELERDWADKFPDMPALSISAKDLRRYDANARIPAVQRMFRAMGQAGRTLEADLYEYDPDLVVGGP